MLKERERISELRGKNRVMVKKQDLYDPHSFQQFCLRHLSNRFLDYSLLFYHGFQKLKKLTVVQGKRKKFTDVDKVFLMPEELSGSLRQLEPQVVF